LLRDDALLLLLLLFRVRIGAMLGESENMVRGVKMFGPELMPYWRSSDEIDAGSLYAKGSSENCDDSMPPEAPWLMIGSK